jgi:predicted DNA binding CopG/RHH family protein
MPKIPKIGQYIDSEEKELIEALESDDAIFVSELTQARKVEIEAMARATINPEREKITLRISRVDLARLKAKALHEGMPYQTLINSILHKAAAS